MGYLAELDLVRGQPEAALQRVEPHLRHDSLLAVLLPVAVRAYVDLGKSDDALRRAEQAVSRARENGELLALTDALWVQGLALTRDGRTDDAKGALEEGLSVARGMPYPYAESRILEAMARVCSLQGDPAGARERLHEALTIVERLGAAGDIERIQRMVAEAPDETRIG
jgi:tetratricopeptide (TPR) repeat protein